jgi:proteasome lid subunit RPN8/RPN11
MNALAELVLAYEIYEEISRHAEAMFPEECCGIVVSNGEKDHVLRLKNVQNARHAQDPEAFPRDATIAYSMDEMELESKIVEAQKIGFRLKAFYHSHPNHEAYFSAEDRAGATPFGEPTYPEAAQIVVSVFDRAVKAFKAFKWSDELGDFVELPIRKHS